MSSLPDGWEAQRLRDCIVGKPEYGANSPSVAYDSALPRYIRITDITGDGRLSLEGVVSVKLDGNEQYILKDKDFLFARSGATVGKSYLYRESDGWAIYAGYLIKFSVDKEILLPEYLDHFTRTYIYWYWVQTTLRAGAQPNINAQEYSSLPIPLPPLAEQRAIADILSTWDEAIALTEQLIAAVGHLKKGLMQQLLTGQVRFPGFDGEEWTAKILGELGQTYSGLSGKSKDDFGFGKKYIPYKNIFDNPVIDPDWMDFVDVGPNENQNRAAFGDIFFTTSSETPNEVGMSSVLLDELEECYLNSFCFGFRLDDFQTLIPEYARYLFRSADFRRQIFALAQGSTRYNLSKRELLKTVLDLPSLGEQKKLADLLATIDDRIDMLERYMVYLQDQKKGLMQQLLTGQIRVGVG